MLKKSRNCSLDTEKRDTFFNFYSSAEVQSNINQKCILSNNLEFWMIYPKAALFCFF